MLRHHGVTPFLVFDGGPLPAKRGTEVDRASWVSVFIGRAQEV
jgi:exonuclease-1